MKKKKVVAIILILIVAIILAAVAGVVIIQKNRNTSNTEEVGNVIDTDSFVLYDEQEELYGEGYILCRENSKWKVLESKKQ